MTVSELKLLKLDVEYHFTNGNYHHILKIVLNKNDRRVYCLKTQFGHEKVFLYIKKTYPYCESSLCYNNFVFHQDFDLSNWSATEILQTTNT